MALIDTYNFNPLSTTDITDELHSDLGSSDYQLGTAARGFKGGADFLIKNVGYQEISNTGNLGTFTGTTVAGIATQSDWELDVTVDSVLYQLADISINIADDWNDVAAAIQTSLQTATSGNETCEIISGKIRIESVDSYGTGSSILIEAGSAGTGSGDLIAAITALSADYTATIDTAVDGETLTEDTDYELSVIDRKRSVETGQYTTQFDIYTRVKILNADYQDTDLYISYKIVLSYPDAVYFNGQNSRITQNETDIAANTASIASIGVLQGYIAGLEISNGTDTDHDIDIAVGVAAADDESKYLALASSFTKQIDAAFAKGTNQGGLDTGSVAADTFYYFWIIEQDSTGDTDILISASQTSPTMPAGWTAKRNIGWAVLTDGSANLLGFRVVDNNLKYDVIIQDVSEAIPAATRQTKTFSIPPNFQGIFNSFLFLNGSLFVLFTETGETDTAPSSSYYNLTTATNGAVNGIEFVRKVDSSSQMYYRASAASGSIAMHSIGFLRKTL